uniref:Uncharacterized protein n=1 Tax=Ascaris lumbricoides TaxID=6252 RepID=A0A0M3IUD0_ASCLU
MYSLVNSMKNHRQHHLANFSMNLMLIHTCQKIRLVKFHMVISGHFR